MVVFGKLCVSRQIRPKNGCFATRDLVRVPITKRLSGKSGNLRGSLSVYDAVYVCVDAGKDFVADGVGKVGKCIDAAG